VEIRRGLFEKTAAIEESGQIVFQRTVAQRIFEFFTFGNVAYDVDQSAAVDARDLDFKWERAAAEFQTHGFAAPRTIAPDGRHDLFFEPSQLIFEVKHFPTRANQALGIGVTESLGVS